MRQFKRCSALLLALMMTVLIGEATAQGAMEAPSAAVAKIRNTYIEALNAKEPATIAALYADDGQLMGLDGTVWTGRDAILEGLTAAAPTWGHFVTTPGPIHVMGNIAWEMGHSVMHTTADDGTMSEVASHYLVILALEDGAWKIKAVSVGAEPTAGPGM